MATVGDVLRALDTLTGGRVVTSPADLLPGANPFVVTKSSDIPGKAVVELPGMICGDPDREVRTLAVTMTVTESAIELAGATGIDCIVAHHPVADAASSGGVPLAHYLGLYGIALFEVHEAFHGLHPGIPFLHGHRPFRVEVAYGGVHGNVMMVGRAFPEVTCLGYVVDRLHRLMLRDEDQRLLELERDLRAASAIQESTVAAEPLIVFGDRDTPLSTVLHIFPHTGFSPADLDRALAEHPEVDTIIASISRVGPDHELNAAIAASGRSFLAGNSHNVEIVENGLPLAYALHELLPGTEIRVLRERATSTPLHEFASAELRSYGQQMAADHLLSNRQQVKG